MMKKLGSALLATLLWTGSASTYELDGELALEGRLFADRGPRGQEQLDGAIWTRWQYFNDWNDGKDSITVVPFLLQDQRDAERSHWDFRELTWLHVGDGWEFRGGLRRVFWGVIESQHLVDIINQTDAVLAIDGEEKLGQPMLNISTEGRFGTLDLYLMSFFRDRTFPGIDGRLGGPLVVADDSSRFEASDGRRHVDVAIRWAHNLENWNFALSHFSGTSREPLFQLEYLGASPIPTGRLIPLYPTIDQTGLELQYIQGGWAWKLEAISRSGYGGDRYAASGFGFEYTQTGIAGSRIDLGWIVEYDWDERGDQAPPGVLEHDLFLGIRWAFNNLGESQLLAGVVVDSDSREQVYWFEGSHRLSDQWKLAFESRIFAGGHLPPTDLTSILTQAAQPDFDNKLGYWQKDDFVQLQLIRYF